MAGGYIRPGLKADHSKGDLDAQARACESFRVSARAPHRAQGVAAGYPIPALVSRASPALLMGRNFHSRGALVLKSEMMRDPHDSETYIMKVMMRSHRNEGVTSHHGILS